MDIPYSYRNLGGGAGLLRFVLCLHRSPMEVTPRKTAECTFNKSLSKVFRSSLFLNAIINFLTVYVSTLCNSPLPSAPNLQYLLCFLITAPPWPLSSATFLSCHLNSHWNRLHHHIWLNMKHNFFCENVHTPCGKQLFLTFCHFSFGLKQTHTQPTAIPRHYRRVEDSNSCSYFLERGSTAYANSVISI